MELAVSSIKSMALYASVFIAVAASSTSTKYVVPEYPYVIQMM
jgi:hypothetical protein